MSRSEPAAAQLPSEQLPVVLFDGVVLAVRDADGRIYMSLRDLCATLELDVSSQRRRILSSELTELAAFRVRSGNQSRVFDFVVLDDLSLWLMTLRLGRRGAAVHERVRYIRQYLAQAVRVAFAELAGLPAGPSSQIEDLRDLDQLEAALRAFDDLRVRHTALETDHKSARAAVTDIDASLAELRTRVIVLEQQAKSRISPEQRNTVYRLVHRWGSARAEHEAGLSSGTAIRRCWAELNARFAVAEYKDLPAARFDEAVGFIKQRYGMLGGEEIEAAAQQALDL